MTCHREKELLEQIEQTGEMYKVSALQLIKAGKRIAELEALNGAMCRDNADMKQERDALAARVEVMRDALATAEGWIIVPERNCSCHISPPCSNCVDKSNAEFDDEMVKAALALHDLSADILRARDARVNAELLYALASGQDAFDGGTGLLPFELRKIAEELEQAK